MGGSTDNKGWDATCKTRRDHTDVAYHVSSATLALASTLYSCSPPQPSTTAIADTGATGHYFTTTVPLTNINHAASPTTLWTATGHPITTSTTADLTLPGLPHAATRVRIVPGFTNNLLSIGQLCDAGCTAALDRHKLTIYDPTGAPILHGHREPTGAQLWRIDLMSTPSAYTMLTRATHNTVEISPHPKKYHVTQEHTAYHTSLKTTPRTLTHNFPNPRSVPPRPHPPQKPHQCLPLHCNKHTHVNSSRSAPSISPAH